MGASTISDATASIALRVSEALKPHHHDKVETASVGRIPNSRGIFNLRWRLFCELDPKTE
jgi:hypothetical protein